MRCCSCNPRNSVVDVVQSVGRVMRKAPGKDYGYIILPVAVPAGVDPSTSAGRQQAVQGGLAGPQRAARPRRPVQRDGQLHRAEHEVRHQESRPRQRPSCSAVTWGRLLTDCRHRRPTSHGHFATTATQMALFSLSQWQEAIYARIVDKVGTRTYWEHWAADVADIAAAHITRIKAIARRRRSRYDVCRGVRPVPRRTSRQPQRRHHRATTRSACWPST